MPAAEALSAIALPIAAAASQLPPPLTSARTDLSRVLALISVFPERFRGTSQLFTKVGQSWPFYSYRMSTLSQTSKELDRTFSAQMLSLVTDLEGSSEVGGLFLHPKDRKSTRLNSSH